ncbi:MAG: ParB/RepB/Spo0J family partition protein [Shimia sp.]
MARRKRLGPIAGPAGAFGDTPRPISTAPIASVAGGAAAASAFEEVAGELSRARAEGRLIQAIPLVAIDRAYLVRDRVVVDEHDMDALRESLRARGQQTPIEVVPLPVVAGRPQVTPYRFGLISGWRRMTALAQLHAETGEDRFATVQALVRDPGTAAEAYIAMVEENEIRVGLSYFERARVVLKSVEQKVFPDRKSALAGLFGSASKAKRSKIGSFVPVVDALDGALAFPGALGERLGLRLAKAIEEDPGFAARLRTILPGPDAEVEQAVLEGALEAPGAPDAVDGVGAPGGVSAPDASRVAPQSPGAGEARPAAPRTSGTPQPPRGEEVAPGLWVRADATGPLTLDGPAVTPELRQAFRDWVIDRVAK